MSNIQFWKPVYQLFKPDEPLMNEALRDFYVRRDDSPVDGLVNLLAMDDTAAKFLLAGHRGGGKTTELRRLEQRCAADYTVVWVDTDAALDKFNIGHAEVTVLIGMQIVQKLATIGWKLPKKLETELRKSLAKVTYQDKEAASGQLELPKVFQDLGMLLRVGFQKETTRTLEVKPVLGEIVDRVNDIIAAAQAEKPKLLVIVDGLDRKEYSIALEMFSSSLLTDLNCHIVYTIPIALRYSASFKEPMERFTDRLDLDNISVFKCDDAARPTGDADKVGRHVLASVVQKRLMTLGKGYESLFEVQALDLLCEKSGGVMRDLVRLARKACEVALRQKWSHIALLVFCNMAIVGNQANAGAGGPVSERLISRKVYIEILRDNKNSEIRIKAIKNLKESEGNGIDKELNIINDEEASKILVDLLEKDPDPKIRSNIAIFLKDVTQKSNHSIRNKLLNAIKNDRDREVRFSIASAFLNIFSDQFNKEELEEVLPIVLDSVKNSQDSEIRALSVDAIGKIALRMTPSDKYINLISESLRNDPAPEVRSVALFSLIRSQEEIEKSQEKTSKLIQIIIDALQLEKEIQVKREMISAFSKLSGESKLAIPILEEISRLEKDAVIKLAALNEILKIDRNNKLLIPEAIVLLRNSSNPDDKELALSIVANNTEKSKDAIPLVVDILQKDSNSNIRSCAALALGMFSLDSRNELAVKALVEALKKDKESWVKTRIIAMFGYDSNSENSDRRYNSPRIDPNESLVNCNSGIAIPGGGIGRTVKESFEPYSNIIFPELIEILKTSKDDDLRSYIIQTLKIFPSYSSQSLEAISQVLKSDPSKAVRSSAARSLKLKSKSDLAISLLDWVLNNDESQEVRSDAVKTLSEFTLNEDIVLPILTRLMKEDKDREIRSHAAQSVEKFCVRWQDDLEKLSINDLENKILTLERSLNILDIPKHQSLITTSRDSESQAIILRTLTFLKARRSAIISERDFIDRWIRDNFWIPALLIVPGIYIGILWLRPRWLLLIPSRFSLPKLGKISPKIILWLKYRPRVMDAWVIHHLGSDIPGTMEQPKAKLRFMDIETVSQHQTYIPLPVNLRSKQQVIRYESPPLDELQKIFQRNSINLLIYGEGGIGKTSLACYIAKLAMIHQTDSRLCKQHPMLPVFIEPELLEQEISLSTRLPNKTTVREVDAVQQANYGIIPVNETVNESWSHSNNQVMIEAIRKQVQFLINEQEPISDELLKYLLQGGRILVIVDRVSEMSEAARQSIIPASNTYPINALVLTSRHREKIGNIQPETLEPLSLTGSELMRFMEEYLKMTCNIELQDQPNLYQACENLQKIVEERSDKSIITVLLARLTVDLLVANQPLPTSIPNLILQSINLLNERVDHQEFKPDIRTVYRDIQGVAWSCLKSTYRPNTSSYSSVIEVLTKLDSQSDAYKRLQYLSEELRIVEIVGRSQDQIRIVLDPMAEYLAGIHLTNIYAKDDTSWGGFFNKVSEFDKQSIQGFMLAVQDCCRVASLENRVSNEIVDKFDVFTS